MAAGPQPLIDLVEVDIPAVLDPLMGKDITWDSAPTQNILGIKYRSLEATVVDTVESLEKNG